MLKLTVSISHIHLIGRAGIRFIEFPTILRSKLLLALLNIVVLRVKLVFCVKIDRVESTWGVFVALVVFVTLGGQGDDFALSRIANSLLNLYMILCLLIPELLQDVTVQLDAFALPAAQSRI